MDADLETLGRLSGLYMYTAVRIAFIRNDSHFLYRDLLGLVGLFVGLWTDLLGLLIGDRLLGS